MDCILDRERGPVYGAGCSILGTVLVKDAVPPGNVWLRAPDHSAYFYSHCFLPLDMRILNLERVIFVKDAVVKDGGTLSCVRSLDTSADLGFRCPSSSA